MGEISWNDFYQNLLLKGEVQEITIHSGVNRATAVLHQGAMYQGRKLPVNVVRFQTPQIDNIETKIREAERSMGITVREREHCNTETNCLTDFRQVTGSASPTRGGARPWAGLWP